MPRKKLDLIDVHSKYQLSGKKLDQGEIDNIVAKYKKKTKKLTAENKALQDLNRLKSEFAAMATHELKVPIKNIVAITEDNAAIFTDRSDKIFFPERHVFEYGNRLDFVKYIPDFVEKVPVYMYTRVPQETIDYIQTEYLDDWEMEISKVSDITGDHALYKFEILNSES